MSTLARLVLSPPPVVSASQTGANTVTVTWTRIPTARSYTLYRNGDVLQAGLTGLSATDTTVAYNQTYGYIVASVNDNGLGPPSNVSSVSVGDVAAPTVPGTPSVAATSTTTVTVSWAASTDTGGSGLAGYRLERSLNGTTGWTQIAEQVGTSYPDTGLSAGTVYYYRVRAYDQALNQSAYSSTGNGATNPATGPVWQTGTINVPLQVGVTADIDIASYVTGETSIELLSGSVPGMTYTPATMRLAGTPTTENLSGSVLNFRASDGLTAAQDWANRISGPGVVWFHNFDSAAEVNAFRWTGGYAGGNDPLAVGNANAQYVQWVASGGADGGGYMQLTRNSSGMDNDYWWRPFNPLTGASNGRGVDDPGANGTIAPRTFIATNGGSQTYNWCQSSNPKHGWYGNAAYADSDTRFDGTDFYVQVRVMADPRRTTPGNISVGKFTSFTTTNDSYTAQELVTYAGFWEGSAAVGKANIHNLYRGSDYSPIDTSVATGQINPVSLKWAYSGGWDTLLYHITPGLNGGTGANRTRIEVWAAKQGETSYTKIWDAYTTIGFNQTGNTAGTLARNGWNAMLCWIYHNGASMSVFWQKYDQIIFSKNFIDCPQT